MVHPNALENKNIVPIEDIFTQFAQILFQEYNADNKFRDPKDEPIKRVYEGEPAQVDSMPAIALHLPSYTWDDAPQDSGSDNEINWQIFCYGKEHGKDPQLKESLRMADAMRLILVANKTINSKVVVYHKL